MLWELKAVKCVDDDLNLAQKQGTGAFVVVLNF